MCRGEKSSTVARATPRGRFRVAAQQQNVCMQATGLKATGLTATDVEAIDVGALDRAIELLEKANAGLQPELLGRDFARSVMARYARLEKLASFGLAAVARKIDEPAEVARATGTSLGKAKSVVTTGKVVASSADLRSALQHGEISLDQAAEIASAEQSAPGSARELVAVAKERSFHVFKEKARKTKLEAEQHVGLAERQHAARSASSYADALGMVHIHLAFEPHVGTPICARAEAEAQRLHKKAKASGEQEPFERHLADAYAQLLAGKGKGRTTRPELVVLVSHEVAKRGWTDVRAGEMCKIPGVGPVSPEVAREVARDAFLTGVFYDGKDLRQIRRWSRGVPVEVALALELGPGPDFDGIKCVDCGNRFRLEKDHVHPHAVGGHASTENLRPRCWPCHQAKTKRDRAMMKARAP